MIKALSGHSPNTHIVSTRTTSCHTASHGGGGVQIKTWRCLTSHPLVCCHQKSRWWQQGCGNRNPHSLLVGVQSTGKTLNAVSLAIPKRLALPYDSATPIPGRDPQKVKIQTNIHNRTQQSKCQAPEKYNVARLSNRILDSKERKGVLAFYHVVQQGSQSEWMGLVTTAHIVNVSIYMKRPQWANRVTKSISSHQALEGVRKNGWHMIASMWVF